jgi:YD repeat-containing protein
MNTKNPLTIDYCGLGDREDFTFASYWKRSQKGSYTDPKGRVTNYGYDNRNRLETTTEPKKASQPANTITRFEYDVAGNKKKVTFPDNNAQ